MKAVLFEKFQAPPKLFTLKDPRPEPHGIVIKVKATGVCRSDWHGWMGHDSDIELPHVPGHELAGVIEAVGKTVTKWQIGDRVTVPFISGCGGLVRSVTQATSRCATISNSQALRIGGRSRNMLASTTPI